MRARYLIASLGLLSTTAFDCPPGMAEPMPNKPQDAETMVCRGGAGTGLVFRANPGFKPSMRYLFKCQRTPAGPDGQTLAEGSCGWMYRDMEPDAPCNLLMGSFEVAIDLRPGEPRFLQTGAVPGLLEGMDNPKSIVKVQVYYQGPAPNSAWAVLNREPKPVPECR